MLHNVDETNEVCDFELLNNIIYIEPHQKFVRKCYEGYSENIKEYKSMIKISSDGAYND